MSPKVCSKPSRLTIWPASACCCRAPPSPAISFPVELARRGAHVDVVEAYRTVAPEDAAAQASAVFGSARRPDCITFTSSSTVRNFVDSAGPASAGGIKVASIGPVTTRDRARPRRRGRGAGAAVHHRRTCAGDPGEL